MEIGNWVRRPGGKWHLIESTVAGDAFTKCGRRMDKTNANGRLEVIDDLPLTRMIGQPQNCKMCDR